MGTVLEFIDRFSFLAAAPSIAGLFVALGMLLLTRRWQVHVLGMLILYFFVALLHTRVIRPEVALVKALIGWLICLALYVTGRYVDRRRGEGREEGATEPSRIRRLPPLAADTPLRSLILLTILVIAYAGSVYFPLPQVPGHVGLACYLLGVGGLFLVGMAEDPLRAGLGLLAFLAGFDLFFGALEPSLAVVGLLGASGFLIALAATFLAVTHATVEEGPS
ncbi:MAG TPA: hypothetical protein EYP77_02500 [Anaerolineae bacterium]|nr:hypothetical protein [Anaerolineae bacterium]